MGNELQNDSKDNQKEEYDKKKMKGQKMHFSELPREMVELVFSFLDPLSIQNVACVSRSWKEMVEIPALWRWAKMSQESLWKDTSQQLWTDTPQQLEIVQSNRIEIVEDFRLVETEDLQSEMENILQRLIGLENLRSVELKVSQVNSQVKPETVATLASTLRSFTLSKDGMEGGIDEDLIPAILRKIASKQNVKTKSLIFMLDGFFFSQVDPELLSEAAVQLSELNASTSGITSLQVSKLFESMPSGNSKLELLCLNDGELFNVSPKLFANALLNLKEISLNRTGLTFEHQKMMFQRLQQEDVKLQKLILQSEHLDASLRYSRFIALEYRRL